jgi:hypothetical protein
MVAIILPISEKNRLKEVFEVLQALFKAKRSFFMKKEK